MNNQADTGRIEGECPLGIWIVGETRVFGFHLLHCSGGERSVDDRKVDTSLLKYRVRFLQSGGVRYCKYTRNTATAFCSSPLVAIELGGGRVELLEAVNDSFLEADDVLFDLFTKSRSHFGER